MTSKGDKRGQRMWAEGLKEGWPTCKQKWLYGLKQGFFWGAKIFCMKQSIASFFESYRHIAKQAMN